MQQQQHAVDSERLMILSACAGAAAALERMLTPENASVVAVLGAETQQKAWDAAVGRDRKSCAGDPLFASGGRLCNRLGRLVGRAKRLMRMPAS